MVIIMKSNQTYRITKRNPTTISSTISDKEKAALFGNHLADIFQSYTGINPNPEEIETVCKFLSSPFPMSLINIKSIRLQKLKPNK